ncbi:MAG: DPP IV N-terminal domain-containing protein [Bacteroidetes bacterium]|nr:DPP IV N-terminal domain-containing protein [Bacteroidota bacterium]
MKKLLFLLVIITSCLSAQDKLFTTEDVVLKSYSSLAPTTLSQLNWIPGEQSFAYVKNDGDNQILVKGFAASDSEIPLVSLENLNSGLEKFKIESASTFPTITWSGADKFVFWKGKKLFRYILFEEKLEQLLELPEEAEELTLSPDGNKAAFVVENNLFVAISIDKILQVTTEGSHDITFGKSVSRNEFGIKGGIFWSPSSRFIAYYKEDLSEVTDFPLVDFNERPAKLKNTKYPMAGMASSKVYIGIFNLLSENSKWLKTVGTPNQYLTSITWQKDERYILVGHLNREQNDFMLAKYETKGGNKLEYLFMEKNDKYVQPLHPAYFLPNSADDFIWLSEKDGFRHLYLFNSRENKLNQITSGDWVVTGFKGFDKSGENCFFTAAKESPAESHLYKVNLKSKEVKLLTNGNGTHNAVIDDSGEYVINSHSSLTIPKDINLIEVNSGQKRLLHSAPNPLKDYKLGEINIFTIKASNGMEFYSKTVLPPDFNQENKYPVIVYVYGGPHAQVVNNTWQRGRYSLWFQQMAQAGFIVFMLDNRGSDNRGLEFEQSTFRNLGIVEIEDQMSGVEYLKSLKYVNADRIGVFGWSYGGYMAASLMLKTDNAFKVGVGGGAVIDWNLYEVMYTERYMDTPETNPEGYDKANLLNYVENLKGKLLFVHGTSDPVVVWQHTLNFAKKAAELNKPLDYYPYVGHEHGVRGKETIHLYEKITNYFKDNL